MHPWPPWPPALLVAACLASSQVLAAEKPQLPNIVVVLADDLGYGDLGCYGAKVVRTPHLERFAREGLRLTSCYAGHANCSPSRAALMTGRTPTRVGVHSWIPLGSPMHLRREEITVATLLRQKGYATAHVGKWHLNGKLGQPGQPQPSDHGFDHWLSTQNNALPNHKDPHNFVRNGKSAGPMEGYAGMLVEEEASRWLRSGRDKTKPFFLYVCFHEPHEPIASARRFTDLYPFPDDPSRAAHHGNISQMDAAFGQLMKTLEKEGLASSTLVFFTSDNGPAITAIHPHGSAGPLRAKKGHLYEGGIRVPGILRWPGRIKEGTVSDEPVSGVDLLPTLCELTGAPLPRDRVIDGASILPLLEGKKLERARPLYWHFVAAQGEPKVALRLGDWKILGCLDREFRPGGDIRPEEQRGLKEASITRVELYNLRQDIAETGDLADQEPERLKEMKALLTKTYLEVREASPTWPAWTWPREESKQIVWPSYYRKKPSSR